MRWTAPGLHPVEPCRRRRFDRSMAWMTLLTLGLAACAPLPRSTGSTGSTGSYSLPGSSGSITRPLPEQTIDLSGRCDQTEEDGFREQARLQVQANQVRALSWRIDVGRRGSCQFELDDFRQVRSRPSIELVERAGGSCRLMVWQVPGRVTLAHVGCDHHCTPGIYEQAWPVMFDVPGGDCAKAH